MNIVKEMNEMFAHCSQFNSDLSQWNVGNVINTDGMFRDCIQFKSDLSQWNTSKVRDMCDLFTGCSLFNSDLSQLKYDGNVSKLCSVLFEYFS